MNRRDFFGKIGAVVAAAVGAGAIVPVTKSERWYIPSHWANPPDLNNSARELDMLLRRLHSEALDWYKKYGDVDPRSLL